MSTYAQTADQEQGPPHVHHMDPVTAYHAAKFGMWLFLATEVLLFGGLFAAFAVYRWYYLSEFHHASHHLNWQLGAVNTLVLLFSSFTAALAVDAAQHGDNARVRKNLLFTICCGCIFLVIKYFEWSAKYHHGLFPGTAEFNGAEFNQAYKSFFGLYYCMTGLHAFHVIAGMGLLFWVFRKAQRNRFSADYYTPVEVGALYWHLVDLIWIYLFPLLYLVG
ncbi:MAG: cytochrome c oxidase subunit 3 family protein [Oligoflexia bacterium]|nr:cytochrome c oxidase subunit 3 family protein [Oligoflexia bacterium]